MRASTPTDAAKKVVPDAAHEQALVDGARDRVRRSMVRRFEAERSGLRALVSRPVMADPVALVRARRQEVAALRVRATTRMEARLHRAADQAEHLRRQVVALSPQSTLERGYAVVQHRDGRIVIDQDDVGAGELLRVRVARGDFRVRPVSAGAEDPAPKTAGEAAARASARTSAAGRTSPATTTGSAGTTAASPRKPRKPRKASPPKPADAADDATS